MTDRKSVPDFAGLFGSPLGGLLGAAASEFFPGDYTYSSTTTTTEEKAGPKYKRADQIGIGTMVITPEGEATKVVSLSDAGEEGSVELVFADGDSIVVWANMKLEVK